MHFLFPLKICLFAFKMSDIFIYYMPDSDSILSSSSNFKLQDTHSIDWFCQTPFIFKCDFSYFLSSHPWILVYFLLILFPSPHTWILWELSGKMIIKLT